MDAIVTAQILNAARLLHESLEGLANRLDTVTSKIDQLVSREMRSAFESLDAAIITDNLKTREQRLSFAENALLLNTGLNSDLSTYDHPNADIIACAHFGLSFISYVRNDQTIAARHLLQAFEVAPRISRQVLAPQLYDKLFFPKCKHLLEHYNDKLSALPHPGSKREIKEVIEHVAYWVNLPFGDDISTVSHEDYHHSVVCLEEMRENSIDEKCSNLARELLTMESTKLIPVQTESLPDGRETFLLDNFVGIIQAFDLCYVSLSHNYVLYCNSFWPGEEEQFLFTNIGSGEFAIRASNDKLVMANRDNNKTLEARADSVREWERFRLVKNGDGTLSIINVDTGKFVSADQNREQILFADRDVAGEWERFKIFVVL